MLVKIPVSVSFSKHTLTAKSPGLVEGDYNNARLIFSIEEDVNPANILFKLSNPQREPIFLQYLDDDFAVDLITNGDDGLPRSLFNSQGLYPFELVWYDGDSKLTSAPGWLNVSQRQVVIADNTVLEQFPMFDKLVLSNIFVRYSFHPDGTDFTEQWVKGQRYIGISSGMEEPTAKEDYTWVELHTPVRGEDYWTEEDKAEIKSYVDEAILGGKW